MSENLPDGYVEPPFHEPCGFCLEMLDQRKAWTTENARLRELLAECEGSREEHIGIVESLTDGEVNNHNDDLSRRIRAALGETK